MQCYSYSYWVSWRSEHIQQQQQQQQEHKIQHFNYRVVLLDKQFNIIIIYLLRDLISFD